MEIKKVQTFYNSKKIEEFDFLSIKFEVLHHVNHAAMLYSKIYHY